MNRKVEDFEYERLEDKFNKLRAMVKDDVVPVFTVIQDLSHMVRQALMYHRAKEHPSRNYCDRCRGI